MTIISASRIMAGIGLRRKQVRCVAAAFYGLNLLMTYDPRWAPIEFGVTWAAALGTIGFRVRRLASGEA
jgi:hypothetical protein